MVKGGFNLSRIKLNSNGIKKVLKTSRGKSYTIIVYMLNGEKLRDESFYCINDEKGSVKLA